MDKRVRKALVGTIATGMAVAGLLAGSAGSAAAGNTGEHLYKGETLWGYGNQYIGKWTSAGVWTLVMQSDGNLVEYKTDMLGYNRQVCWSTGTWWAGAAHASYQDDGNFVVYSDNGGVLWASNTDGRGGSTVDINSKGAIYVGTTRLTNDC